jgi:hypothetical protein
MSRPQVATIVVIALASLFVREYFGFEYPSWVHWITTAIVGLIGAVVAISPEGTPGMRPAFARAAGIAIVVIATFNAYRLLA